MKKPDSGVQEVPARGNTICNPHPDAPHGFDRDASHNASRYVCECEGWMPPIAGVRVDAAPISDERIRQLFIEYGWSDPLPAKESLLYELCRAAARQGALSVQGAKTPDCNCPGNGKQDKNLHAPNCPYRNAGVKEGRNG